jgi:outer membrane protein OmpA-like peptidoglycan-associated protein
MQLLIKTSVKIPHKLGHFYRFGILLSCFPMRLIPVVFFFFYSLGRLFAQTGCPLGYESAANSIVNSQFEEGFQGFYSDYKKTTTKDWFSGSLHISENPTEVHNNYRLCLDTAFKHRGKMLVVDGAEDRSKIVWQQKIKVTPQTDHYFSLFFATLLKPNPAQLEISINAQRLPKSFDYHYQHCRGSVYFCYWNSGLANEAIITIRATTTELMGNDFVLDDMQFFPCTKKVEPKVEQATVIKKTYDSVVYMPKPMSKGSYVANLEMKWRYVSDSLSNKADFFVVHRTDLLLSIKAKGFFTLTDTIKALPSYPDSLFIKDYNMVSLDSGVTFTLSSLTFERSSAILTLEAKKGLQEVVQMLSENPEVNLAIHGHTDNVGDAVLNFQLSVERVNSVRDFLIQSGVKSERLNGKGFGGTKPVVGVGTEQERKSNRRVEFIIVK